MHAHHKSTITFTVAGSADDPRPCDLCEHLARCGIFRQACYNYLSWADTGKMNSRAQEPNSRIYWQIFPEDIRQ